jgi:hypothetical protein
MSAPQCLGVAGLLVSAVAQVLGVNVDVDSELTCHLHGVIGARLVYENQSIGDSRRMSAAVRAGVRSAR